MQCSGVDAMVGCLYNIHNFMQYLGAHAEFVFLDVNSMFRICHNVRILMQYLGVDARFL